jgi:preprotein translocase SecE subunit
MANKTVDRRKAVPHRSQAAKAGPTGKPVRPNAGKVSKQSSPKMDEAARSSTEVLEAKELEAEELAVDEVDEEVDAGEAEADVVEEDEVEEAGEEQPAERRSAKKERDLMAITPPDYGVSRPTGARLPNNAAFRFVRSSYRELRLVTWPSRRDVASWSLVVVVVCVVIAAVLGVVDFGLARFVEWWVSLAH